MCQLVVEQVIKLLLQILINAHLIKVVT
uniref:Uncharacterized protein n=1 Tax=Anguilla anguilla TaxID=7936 RepID=A0A0E9VCP3_ANGAN